MLISKDKVEEIKNYSVIVGIEYIEFDDNISFMFYEDQMLVVYKFMKFVNGYGLKIELHDDKFYMSDELKIEREINIDYYMIKFYENDLEFVRGLFEGSLRI